MCAYGVTLIDSDRQTIETDLGPVTCSTLIRGLMCVCGFSSYCAGLQNDE